MELRWILILAGIGILFFLYLSGRPRKARRSVPAMPAQAEQQYSGQHTPSMNGNAHGVGDPALDPLLEEQQYGDLPRDPRDQYTAEYQGECQVPPQNNYTDYADGDYSGTYYSGAGYAGAVYTGHPNDAQHPDGMPSVSGNVAAPSSNIAGMGFEIDPNDMSRPGSPSAPLSAPQSGLGANEAIGSGGDENYANAGLEHPANSHVAPTQAKSSLGATLGSIGLKLRGRKNAKSSSADASLHPMASVQESKVITLHVVAPQGQVIHGPRLLSLFESHNFHFGEMNIFHSIHEGKIVFSVAKMVEPGEFDLNVPASFETPGITMILQLPGPVAADVAFEVLISEASDLAEALGCTVLDSGHSTLSKQTVQHMREEIYQFMHRQRLAEAVPS